MELTVSFIFFVMSNIAYLPSSAPTLRTLLPKSLPVTLSQPIADYSVEVLRTAWSCEFCARQFKTDRGRKQHQSKCTASVIHPTPVFDRQNVAIIPVQPLVVQPLVWGSHNLQDIELIINSTYDEIVRWRKNIFMLPLGATGKEFIRETTSLLNLWMSDALLSSIAWKASLSTSRANFWPIFPLKVSRRKKGNTFDRFFVENKWKYEKN